MYTNKNYSFGSRGSRDYGDATKDRESGRHSYVSDMYISPGEGKIERENYLTKDDSKRVSENITKSFVTKSVIDKRSTSSYRTREESQSVKTRDLPGMSGRNPSSALSSSKNPITSFYSTYSKDEDLSDAVNQSANGGEDVISSFYRSSVGSRKDSSVEQRAKIDVNNGDSKRTTSYKASSAGVCAAREVSWRTDKATDSSGSLGRRRSLQSIKETDKETGEPKAITSEDVNILRRALERKDASNSLERERLSKKFSADDGNETSKQASKAYMNVSNKHGDGGSYRMTTDQFPRTRSSVTTAYDFHSLGNASKAGKDDVDSGRRASSSSDWRTLPGEIKARSRSTESLDDKERSRLGIYKELPGRKEFLSYSRSLSNTGTSRSDEDRRLSGEGWRTGSLDRHTGSVDLRSLRYRDLRASSLSRLRSRSSEELRSSYKDKENKVYPSYQSRHLHRQGNVEREGSFVRDWTNRRDFRARELGSSTHDKLREDLAKLKAETESRVPKRNDIKLYSFSREPTIHDKLKEEIAKLNAETLTRDHVKPYIPPSYSREEPADISSRWRMWEPSVPPSSSSGEPVDISSRWRSREPSIQDKLREDIARLKAETEKIPAFPRRASSFTTEIIIPDRRMEEIGDVRQGGLSRKLVERYNVSKKDGDVFKDESRSEETQRYGDAKVLSEGDTARGRSSLTIAHQPSLRDELTDAENNIRDEAVPGSSRDFFHPSGDLDILSLRRASEGAPSMLSSRPSGHDLSLWPKEDESRLTEPDGFLTSPRELWDDPTQTGRSSNVQSAEAYARKRVYRADSAVSVSSTRDSKDGPSSVKEYFRGSVSKDDRSAYFSRKIGDREDGYRDYTKMAEPVRQPIEEAVPEPVRRPDKAIPLPRPGYDSVTRRLDDSISTLKRLRDESRQKDRKEREEVRSDRAHSSREFVTRKTIRDDSVISRESSKDDVSRSLSSKVETPRRMSETSKLSPRRTSTREDIASEEIKVSFPEEIVVPITECRESKPSPAISELRKKIDQLQNKVDALDDSRARMKLEKYVDKHSEKKQDVEIKAPVNVKRYQLSERRSQAGSVVDGPDPQMKRESIDVTSDMISRQISRQTSEASTIRRISSIREDELRATQQSAQTMTAPDVQEHVGTRTIQRQDSIVNDRDRLRELRGVPIDHRRSITQIEQVGTGQVRDSGVTTIQIDTQQQILKPKKDAQEWWNAFTAEDVDRLLELGKWSPWNAYTAEDVDRMFQQGPVRRRSFRRGSSDRRSFRKHYRRIKNDPVDVLVRVRGRQEKRSRPQCIIAQAAPQEKAIVLRETKETTEPYIRKIKVDDVYGADAVRVENGVVKIKVGDLSTKGRKAWASILQQKNRIVESDGTVTIPITGDHYEDGVYYTNYYQGQQQDGAVRVPIKFKIQQQNAARSNKIRVARDMRRTGSVRRRRKTASGRGYIVGARYYSGKMMLTSGDTHRLQARTQSDQKMIVSRQQQDKSRVTGNEIVLRRPTQSAAFPMKTIQRIHEGHRTTSQAATSRTKDGKMVITVHAVPPRPPRFSLKHAGQNMTSSSYYGSTSEQRGVSNTSGKYFASSTSGSRGYVTSPTSGRRGSQGTSYYVTDPSDSFGRRSGYQRVSSHHSSNEVSSTPTIIPYEDDYPSRRGSKNDSFIVDPSSFYGIYDAPGSRIVASDPRLNAHTGYGEKFNVRDHGGVSSVHYVNGARQRSRIINERMTSNGHYRYGSSWNSRQQDKLNGRSMSWAVEEVVPDF